jgi:hypothetical protein
VIVKTALLHRALATIFVFGLGFGAVAFPSKAKAQDLQLSAAKSAPNFSRLAVSPGSLSFKQLKFPPGPAFEDDQLKISNSGKGSEQLQVTVASPTGSGAAAFKILSGEGALPPLEPGASATVTVRFQPLADGTFSATILISSDGTQGAKTQNDTPWFGERTDSNSHGNPDSYRHRDRHDDCHSDSDRHSVARAASALCDEHVSVQQRNRLRADE